MIPTKMTVSMVLGLVTLCGACAQTVVLEDMPTLQAVSCQVVRQECQAEGLSSSGAVICTQFGAAVTITATTCFNLQTDGDMKTKCSNDFCGASQSRDGFNGSCIVPTAQLANLTPVPSDPSVRVWVHAMRSSTPVGSPGLYLPNASEPVL